MSQNGLLPMCIECLFLRTMSGPCWGHIWPSSTLRPAEALKFVKIEWTWSEANIYGVSIFGGPCEDHVGTLFSLALLISSFQGAKIIKICVNYLRPAGSQFKTLCVLCSKNWRKQTLIFKKIMGVCFLQLFDPSTPRASNCNLAACEYFRCKFIEIWDKMGSQIKKLENLHFKY